MALDQIWKQQLTLVTYGNEYLSQKIGFQPWINHSIFNQYSFQFRDLSSQHLLAQHFQIWLEGLKKEGCQRISLHHSNLITDEQNPNVNVELLPFAHFIVSHHPKAKFAWILGKELPEWYSAENDYEPPEAQKIAIQQETFWRYELTSKVVKKIDADISQQPNWDDIHEYTENELFKNTNAQGFIEPISQNMAYTGITLNDAQDHHNLLSLLPTTYTADYANQTLIRLDSLSTYIQSKIQQPYHEDGSKFTPEEQLMAQHFAQKTDDLSSKFIVKVANHYQTARLTPVTKHNPLDDFSLGKTPIKKKFHDPQISNKSSVITLVIVTIIICLVGYYFGL
ncbi:hypothetical protein B9T31_06475 [Acinetobacter sp. ANC 4558]|uniref:hypothetical protein n=1 Tax=Acinetobacter sp. ANC 4558 TaxID=1977876 RepID=UPI000A333514|nr:hypothetical protein [Acinetobacter sp. ANC 4558]OTG86647.1 hypothetical protein B9T31_06475 [Acinetobacter sp. ANC 4558]